MLFHASFTDPAAQLAALLAAANDHQARALVLGNGVFRGFFVVESVATSDIQLGADATPIAIRVRASLREWAPGSEFDPAAPPQLASVALGIAPVAISYSSPVPLLAAAAFGGRLHGADLHGTRRLSLGRQPAAGGPERP